MEQKGIALWLTGLSGAGKTTIAYLVGQRLKNDHHVRVQVLDGDLLRKVFSKDLGFTREDRFRHIERAAFIAKLLIEHGVITIASFITPYQEMRDYCRKQIGSFAEIYIKCPLSECIERDVKGLYKKALKGKIPYFTGISDPYEEPVNPDLVIETATESPDESAERVIHFLGRKGYIQSRMEDEQL
ncbi:adenylyl-sulfate kinase [Paenactinomyces guangxiensis]|uniref:Adenylyl-sulfate kinase n=1 Tax=Paenactinomyces guangxiensis TaxID=1490290 RepID=A0A7W1WR20_9BACL|nr:adenylyl-sulfate kinase [Paenactinomyces guangxiensis]MBA4494475.1 adenylyl-sulfate kinase [Paenactinomyces guangxiensis]MBH8591470.1 adenylyl-sulfate kinase [Paenactinomyces guangxiensis]